MARNYCDISDVCLRCGGGAYVVVTGTSAKRRGTVTHYIQVCSQCHKPARECEC